MESSQRSWRHLPSLVGKELKEFIWLERFHQLINYLVFWFPCISQCIGHNWHVLIQKCKNRLGIQRVNFPLSRVRRPLSQARQDNSSPSILRTLHNYLWVPKGCSTDVVGGQYVWIHQVIIGNKTDFKVWRKRLLKLANVYLMHTEQ